MYRCFAALLCILCTTSIFAQTTTFKAQKLDSQAVPELDFQFTGYQVYQLDVQSLDQAVKGAQAQYNFQLQLGSDYSWNLDIVPNDLRGKEYQIKNSFGTVLQGHEEVITFSGFIKNNPASSVRLTIDEGLLYGYVSENGHQTFIEPLWYFVENAPKDQFVTYHPEEVRPRNTTCGFTEMQKHQEGLAPDVSSAQSSSTINCYEVELAMAADFSMFQKHGSVAGVEAHVMGVLNNVQGNYDDEFQDEIQFVVAGAFYSDCNACDPWTASSAAGTLLGSFRSWGNSGGFGFTYDVAELWTNRDLDGSTIGIAYLNGICNSNRYHVIQDFSNNANLLRVVVAHELGHNFSAQHDGSGSGFIMAPSVNNTSTWSPASINSIDNFVNNLANQNNCLTSCASQVPPLADFTANITTGCTPLQVQFTDLSVNSPSSWTWTFPGGTPATSNQQNPTVIYNTPGIYDVILQVVNAAGSDVITNTDYIEIFGPPTADFDVFINDFTVLFSNFSTDATSYFWDFGDGETSLASDPTHVYQQDGIYNVFLEATNACGTTTYFEVIEIITQPIPAFEATITEGCGPLEVLFVNLSSSNVLDYNWFFPGGNPATSENSTPPVVTYNTPGFYDVTLEVSNLAGTNSITETMYIHVLDNPSPDYTYSQTGNVINFTNTSTDANTYSWDFGDGTTSNEVNPSHTYTADGTYTVVLTVFGDCGTEATAQIIVIANQPSAGATADVTSGCAPLTVNFSNQSSANATSWSWTFPGGTPSSSTAENPTVTYNTAGTYDVMLTVSNATGTDMITLSNYISINDVPSVGFSSTVTGTQVNFTNTSSNATSYSWDFGDGTTSTDANPSHTYASDGTYTVILVATNACGSVTSTETVVIVTPPNAGASANVTSGCAPLTVNFSNQSSANATAWSWTFPGGTPSSSTAENPTVTYNTTGTYDVMLTVSNASGTDMITLSNYISINDVPSVGFSSTVNGTLVNFTNTSSNATSYSWDFGDGTTSTEANPSHTYTMDGTYTVVLIATNACGSVTSTETVVIITAPNAGASANVTSGCAPLTVNFSNQSSANATAWSWTFPGGTPSSSTAENPTVTYNTAGTYDVMLTVSNAAGTDMITLSNYISINDVPSVGFSSTVNGTLVNFTNTSSNATSYSWDFGDGTTSTEANPSHTYTMDGTYTVILVATNACGSVTSTDNVNIGTAPNAGATADVTSGCAPLTVNFSNQSSANATSWSWTFPGGTPSNSTAENPTVTYNTAGTYDVMLTVSNATGTDMITLSNYISINDVPSVGFSSTVTGTQVNFTNTSSNATSYSWDFGDGTTSTEANPSHTYTMDGTYTVILVATNACGSVTSTETVVIVTPPSAGASANVTSGCAPLTVNFSNQSSANATSWSWTFPGGTPSNSTAENPTVTYNTAGTYDVMLTVSNAAGTDMITLSNYININDVPSVGFSSTVNGTQVNFTNTSSNATSYSWDFGDGTTSTEANPSHTYAMDGTYTVILVATNACGSVTSTDNVNIGTAPNAGATADVTSGCAPLTVNFSNQSSANATSWSWTFPGGTPSSSTAENPTVTYNTAGTYDVMLTVSNATGTDMITLSNYISINDVPSVGFSSTVTGTQVNFTNTSSNATSYSWDFGDGTTSTEANPSHTYTMDGTYTVILVATNACGSVTSTETVVIVTPPSAGASANVTSGCAPLTVNFSNQSSANATSWSWTFPGGTPSNSTAENPTVTYNTAGTYDVMLTVSNAAGTDMITLSNYISINEVPSVGFNLQQMDLTANFTNTSTNATSYSWDFGDGATSTEANPSHAYAAEGTYTVVLVATNACGSVTYSTDVEITLGPLAGFSADVNSGCAPLTVQFSDQSSGNATGWLWTFPGGNPSSSTLQNPVVVYANPGLYDVSLEITSAMGGNSLTQVSFIEVLAQPTASFSSMTNGLTTNFTNSSNNATSYNWDFGDGTSSTATNPSHTYTMDGTYTVVLTAINECGEVTSTSVVVIVTAPTAGFSASEVVGCAPFSVEFLDQSSPNTTAWLWSFPGGVPATSTEQNPKVEYATPGNYTVTLEVSNSAGSNSITQVNYIKVNAAPLANFSSSVLDNQVQFFNQSTGATSYFWDFGDGTNSTEVSPTHIYANSGDYTVILTVSNACGTVTFTQVITITIVTLPSAGLTTSVREGCAPLEVQFTDQSSANTTTWEWHFDGGTPAVSAAQNPLVTYNTAGLYAVQLIASNSLGADTITFMDYIHVLDVPMAAFTYDVINFNLDFMNASSNATSYVWDFGDGSASNETNPSHTFPGPGTYTVVLTATNECGTVSTTQVIVLTEGGTAPTAGFSATPTSGCGPLTVQFSDQSAGSPTSWSWTFVGGIPATSTEQNPVVVYSQPGVYGVTLEVSNALGSNTLVQSNVVEVLASAIADFTFVTDNSGTIQFTNTSSNATSYSWDFGDGNSSIEENPTHTYTASGTYTVTLKVVNECGESISTQTIEVTVTTGIEDLSFIQSLDLYPNPNSGQFVLTLQGTAGRILELKMHNVLGQVVTYGKVTFNGYLRQEFDLSNQPSGVYLLQLRSEGSVSYLKVVVE